MQKIQNKIYKNNDQSFIAFNSFFKPMSFVFHFSQLSGRKAKCCNCVTIVTLDQRWSCRVKRTRSFFRQNSILKHPVLYISFYITCINSFMSLYRTTSSRPDPVWLPSAVRRGLFHFRFAPLIRGPRSYGVEWAVAPPRTICCYHYYLF